MQGPRPLPGADEKKVSWWQVMCLTGVDYSSRLGYQPAIVAPASEVTSSLANLVLIAVTLFGPLPLHRRVAVESPRGSASIVMLERLLPHWGGKFFGLALLSFTGTDSMVHAAPPPIRPRT